MGNPFAITFGKTPENYIPRIAQREHIVQDFNSSTPSTNAYMAVGVRGSGKTVLLNEIEKKIGNNWIVINLNAQTDLMESLTSQLYSNRSMHKHFIKSRIDLSAMGIGAQFEEAAPALDYQTAITRMLEEVEKQNKKVLVLIDEITGSTQMKVFSAAFQIFVRENLPLYLVMAGIPENVYSLINDKGSTFLYRAPRINMTPLRLEMIQRSYMRTLKVSEETADELARLTNGYPFAYQVLGYVCWGHVIDTTNEEFREILTEYDNYLYELSYDKIWSELSDGDRKFIKAVAEGFNKSSEIEKQAEMDIKTYSVYRDRLIKKGLIDPQGRGIVRFSLPRFDKYVIEKIW